MLSRFLIAIACVLPQVATAADLPFRRHHTYHHHHTAHRSVMIDDRYIACTTTDLGLFTFSNCGQSFDPLSVAAGR